MFGTSYSGFNSLQIAAERPPALKAIVAIYSSDDRWTDDVHWRGHALRLVDLVDYCHYMTPMCVLPPVPAEWPGDWRAGVEAALGDQRAVAADLAAREPGRPVLAGRVAPARGLRPDPGGHHDRGRLGGRLPQQHLPHRRGARRGRHAVATAGRALGARRPGDRHARAADRSRPRDGRLVGPVAARDRCRRVDRPSRRLRPYLHRPRARPRAARGPLGQRAVAAAGRRRRDVRARRAALAGGRAGHRRLGVDRLRRPPPVGAVRRPARGRRPLADLGLGRAAHGGRPASGPAPAQRVRTRRVALGEALRRLPRRHLGADRPRLAGPGVP